MRRGRFEYNIYIYTTSDSYILKTLNIRVMWKATYSTQYADTSVTEAFSFDWTTRMAHNLFKKIKSQHFIANERAFYSKQSISQIKMTACML